MVIKNKTKAKQAKLCDRQTNVPQSVMEKKKVLSECESTKAQMGYKLACTSRCSSVSLIHQTLNNQLLSCGGSC